MGQRGVIANEVKQSPDLAGDCHGLCPRNDMPIPPQSYRSAATSPLL